MAKNKRRQAPIHDDEQKQGGHSSEVDLRPRSRTSVAEQKQQSKTFLYLKRGWLEVTATTVVAVLCVMSLISPSLQRPQLPLQFRPVDAPLTNLPVRIDQIRSCGCWAGPHSQAQKKFKLAITNNSSDLIHLTGSEQSSLRLLVGYKIGFKPQPLIPNEDSNAETITSENRDVAISQVRSSRAVDPLAVTEPVSAFSLPDGYQIWAIPPTPNKTVELYETGKISHATIVDKEDLLPGESFSDDRKGHGAWIFNVPLPSGFLTRLIDSAIIENGEDATEGSYVLDRALIRQNVAVLGIAVVSVDQQGVPRIIGFAPSPPDTELEQPSDL